MPTTRRSIRTSSRRSTGSRRSPRMPTIPTVTLAAHRRGVLAVEIFGDASEATLREVAEQVRDRLLGRPRDHPDRSHGRPRLRDPGRGAAGQAARLRPDPREIASRIGSAAVEIPGRQRQDQPAARFCSASPTAATGPATSPTSPSSRRRPDRSCGWATSRPSARASKRSTASAATTASASIGLEVYRVGDETPITAFPMPRGAPWP